VLSHLKVHFCAGNKLWVSQGWLPKFTCLLSFFLSVSPTMTHACACMCLCVRVCVQVRVGQCDCVSVCARAVGRWEVCGKTASANIRDEKERKKERKKEGKKSVLTPGSQRTHTHGHTRMDTHTHTRTQKHTTTCPLVERQLRVRTKRGRPIHKHTQTSETM